MTSSSESFDLYPEARTPVPVSQLVPISFLYNWSLLKRGHKAARCLLLGLHLEGESSVGMWGGELHFFDYVELVLHGPL